MGTIAGYFLSFCEWKGSRYRTSRVKGDTTQLSHVGDKGDPKKMSHQIMILLSFFLVVVGDARAEGSIVHRLGPTYMHGHRSRADNVDLDLILLLSTDNGVGFFLN
jgi:hypothetical protein